jgi:hypothetical protein
VFVDDHAVPMVGPAEGRVKTDTADTLLTRK